MTVPGAPGISGETRVAGVIGWPVRHSLSPAIHNAAYSALGLDWVYLAFPVPEGAVPAALAGFRALDLVGLSVTMPHKAAAAAAVDVCTPDAIALRAVNSIRRDGDRLVGDNTDGGGLVDSLRADSGIDPSGRRVVVVGAGGAARAAIRALALAGAAEVTVVNRDPGRATQAAALAGPVGTVGTEADLATADLVVQATPVGMGDDGRLPFDPERLAGHAAVVDLVYHPLETPLLAAVRSRGLVAIDGLGMLVHQAARQFTAWTGLVAPVDAMRDAVRSRLA